MKFSTSFEFASGSLPLRWNAIGMIAVGCILMLAAMSALTFVVLGEFNGYLTTNPGQRWIGYGVAAGLAMMAMLFLFVGRWLYKTAGPVTNEVLAGRDMLTTAFTKPDGSVTIKTGSSLPLFHWIGRIFSTAGCLLYAGGLYSIFIMEPRPTWGKSVYLFGIGSWILMIGSFFLWYRRKIIRAKAALENTL